MADDPATGLHDAACLALRFLLAESHTSGPDELPGLVAKAGQQLGASTTLYLADYDQITLIPFLPPDGTDHAREGEAVPIEGTLAGRAFSHVDMQHREHADQLTVWLPVLDGVERLGVLQMEFADSAGYGQVGAELREAGRALASLIGELLTSKQAYGDAIEITRRRLPMSLPAELQWNLLPPLTFTAPGVAISGIVEPTNEIAGDSFDYSIHGAAAKLAVFDAMGHGLEALLLASVAVGGFRNARRCGLDLVDSARSVDRHIAAQFGPDKFVTGIMAELNIRSGVYQWVTCGHPPALVLRGGHIVKQLESVINPPLGLLDGIPEVGQERLQRGDRVILHTDGVVEARNAKGEFFGIDRLADFITRAAASGLPAAETLRRLNLAILDHQEGVLQDDATTLLVEWAGDEAERMTF